MVYPSLIN